MRLSLTLCLLASYLAVAGSSPQSTEIYSEWSSPINVGPPVNTESNDNYAILSRDELTMYFTSDRPGGACAAKFGRGANAAHPRQRSAHPGPD